MDDQKELSRKNFIKIGGIATVLGLVSAPAVAGALTPKPDDDPRKILSGTATAVAVSGKESSFDPDRTFSQEFFERVR